MFVAEINDNGDYLPVCYGPLLLTQPHLTLTLNSIAISHGKEKLLVNNVEQIRPIQP